MPSKSLQAHNPNAWNAAIAEGQSHGIRCGSCYHCATGIRDHYIIQCGDGSRHAIGSSCIAKLAEKSGMIDRVAHEAKLAKRSIDQQKREERAGKNRAELAKLVTKHAAAMKAAPHSKGFTNRKTGEPLTMMDEVEWLLENSGDAGQSRLLKRLRTFASRQEILNRPPAPSFGEYANQQPTLF